MSSPAENPQASAGNGLLKSRVEQHLEVIYPGGQNSTLAEELLAVMGLPLPDIQPQPFTNLWNESDVLAITYGNSVLNADEAPLHSLHGFLKRHFSGLLSGVHLLPFFPHSSDDGFAVKNYDTVDPELGDWEDIRKLSGDFRIMGDLVINHCSSQHPWFLNYQLGAQPGSGYFVEADPAWDLSAVVRPRTSPLLRPTPTPEGEKLVWCTFSHDQVDLDFSNPAVLTEFVRIVRRYLDAGISIFRLDAIAFLWKVPGTDCLNLPQTHEVVRLLRTLIEHRNPRAVIITETNIPNQENLSYFGNANEAHIIYNFSLPPLLVNALVSGSCRHLKTWMMSMPPAQHGTTFLNFIASHDGIGLRPAEGLLDEDELTALIRSMESFGGHISWRALNSVERRPYEINISLIDALKGTLRGVDEYQLARFVCAHTIMLALEGIPAFYIHSLLATENDHQRVEAKGHYRAINRHQWQLHDIEQLLADENSLSAMALARLRHLITVRKRQPAFHPNATQFTMHLGDAVFAFWRQSMDRRQSIFALNNVSDETQIVPLAEINLISTDHWYDLISGDVINDRLGELRLAPYQSVWLSNLISEPAKQD